MNGSNKIRLLVLKKTLNILLFLITLLLTKCDGYYTSWEKDREINGVKFRKIRYEIIRGDTLSIIGYLRADSKINGFLCSADWIHFTKDWELKLFRLNEETVINGFKYEKDTWIRFTDQGSVICVFPVSTEVQGYICKGGGGPKGISTAFYEGGRLHYFFSMHDVFVGDIKCKGGVLNIIGLYENGTLQECTLAQETEINGVRYRKNTNMVFNEDGSVKSN